LSAEEAGVSAADGRDAAAACIASGEENICCTKAAMFCMVGGRRKSGASTFNDFPKPADAGKSDRERCI
jgi:hypothetical protein